MRRWKRRRSTSRLVFEKLRLKPGDRLLDVGCGWGGMVRYAARHGVKAIGVTLVGKQRRYIADEEQPSSPRSARVHRDIGDSSAVSSTSVCTTTRRTSASCSRSCAPAVCCSTTASPAMTTGTTQPRRVHRPLRVPGRRYQNVGLEVLHEENLRHHYANAGLVLTWWSAGARRPPRCLGTAKVWGLYMAGSGFGFEHNAIRLHQVLAVKLDERAVALVVDALAVDTAGTQLGLQSSSATSSGSRRGAGGSLVARFRRRVVLLRASASAAASVSDEGAASSHRTSNPRRASSSACAVSIGIALLAKTFREVTGLVRQHERIAIGSTRDHGVPSASRRSVRLRSRTLSITSTAAASPRRPERRTSLGAQAVAEAQAPAPASVSAFRDPARFRCGFAAGFASGTDACGSLNAPLNPLRRRRFRVTGRRQQQARAHHLQQQPGAVAPRISPQPACTTWPHCDVTCPGSDPCRLVAHTLQPSPGASTARARLHQGTACKTIKSQNVPAGRSRTGGGSPRRRTRPHRTIRSVAPSSASSTSSISAKQSQRRHVMRLLSAAASSWSSTDEAILRRPGPTGKRRRQPRLPPAK